MDYPALVRRLLRQVRRPHELERDALGLALMRAVKAASVRAALADAVAQTFAGESWTLHRTVLERYDLGPHVPRFRAAAELGLSPRRFYYLHAEAVERLARHVAELMQTGEPGLPVSHLADLLVERDPQAAAALLDDEYSGEAQPALRALYARIISTPYRLPLTLPSASFAHTEAALAAALHALRCEQTGSRTQALAELDTAHANRCDHLGNPSPLVQAAILHARATIARHDGDAAALAAAARSSRALPAELPHGFEPWAHALGVEAALAAGDAAHAAELLDAAIAPAAESGAYRYACLLSLADASLLLMQGDFDGAERLARAVSRCAGSHADIAGAAYIARLRVAVLTEAPLPQPAPEAYSRYDDLAVHALTARAAMQRAEPHAFDEAAQVQREALRLGYRSLAAHAAATLAMAQGGAQAAIAAWRIWLTGRHALDGADLMPRLPVPALLCDSAAVAAVHELAKSACADWPLLRFLERPGAAERFWPEAMRTALDGAAPEAFGPMLSAVLNAPSSGSQHLAGGASNTRAFAAALSPLVPLASRAAFCRALAELLSYCNARARRALERERARAVLELSG